ncbi:MAG TPA: hypothetical protein VE998_01540 [Terriglobales bacterium]|nr:hypothetical protein [Terriglobales bacterium]
MSQAAQQPEFAYCVKIETTAGQSANVPVAFLTSEQLKRFLETDFKRLVEGAGMNGARVHVERAITADYEKVLGEISACLRKAGMKIA